MRIVRLRCKDTTFFWICGSIWAEKCKKTHFFEPQAHKIRCDGDFICCFWTFLSNSAHFQGLTLCSLFPIILLNFLQFCIIFGMKDSVPSVQSVVVISPLSASCVLISHSFERSASRTYMLFILTPWAPKEYWFGRKLSPLSSNINPWARNVLFCAQQLLDYVVYVVVYFNP